jgi:hypothetical protein
MFKKLLSKLGIKSKDPVDTSPWYSPHKDSEFDLSGGDLFVLGKKFDKDEKHENLPVVHKEKVKRHVLELVFNNGTNLTWTTDVGLKENYFPYDKFYTWYLTKETPLFVFENIKGENIIKRCDIFMVSRKKAIIIEKEILNE